MGELAGHARLGRRDRVRDRRDFLRLGREASRSTSKHFVLLVGGRHASVPPTESGRARLGITVSRRVGGAVVRNLVKRRIREVFRCNRLGFEKEADVLVIARPGAAQLPADAAAGELLELFARSAS
jgi:ribonuclease P protein component